VTGKKILIKSTQYSIILTIINVFLSLVLSQLFNGGLETNLITGNLGNITLLESVCLFLAAPVSLYNSASTKVSKKDEGSNEGEVSDEGQDNEEGEDYTIARVPDGRGWRVALIGRRRIAPIEGDGSRVGRAFTLILCGAILFIEIVALALISGY
jgi:hypothetical protein